MPMSMRFQRLRKVSALILAVGLLGAMGALAGGGYFLRQQELGNGFALLVSGVALLVISVLAYCQLLVMQKFESNTYRLYDALLDSTELTRQQTEFMRTMADNTSLSDWAKKVVFREKDHEYLRDSIHGAIIRQDWEAAMHLIQSLDTELGYAEEARQLVAEVERSRKATMEQRIEAAVKRFDELCAARKWEQARRDIVRLLKLFPDNDRIAGLQPEVELRRQQYKRQLLKEYDQAARRNDVERATQMLVELDQYLAPNEGAALKDSARGVFRAKLMQMGVQFSLAVSDKQFNSAIEIGERIMRDYPNSRYAHEIADMLPLLKRRLVHE